MTGLMRIDHHLNAASSGLDERPLFFLATWFNLVHQHSLDAYRVRAMNPLNILRELARMLSPPAGESDRRTVAEEAIEILSKQPVLQARAARYPALGTTLALISEASHERDGGFKKHDTLLRSYLRELEAAFERHFLQDCLAWMEAAISDASSEEAKEDGVTLDQIERVCGDILSVAHDDGFSLESLFHFYRHLVTERQDGGAGSAGFLERFRRVKDELLAPVRTHKVVFQISGVTTQASQCCGEFGSISISGRGPSSLDDRPRAVARQFSDAQGRLFAYAEVLGRDGRVAGRDAYRQIGQILDLMRFEYDTPKIEADPRFLLNDEGRFRLVMLPQQIPNPQAEVSTRTFKDFVENLQGLAERDPSKTETRDRVFSAFRLYRLGTGSNIFENKLVYWWTGIEYLASGGRAGRDIGETVKNALVPSLVLSYLPKHLTALRSALSDFDVVMTVDGGTLHARDCSNSSLYDVLKGGLEETGLGRQCVGNPYLKKHLQSFIARTATPHGIWELLVAHDRRVRWQLERIYRARCDIVHTGAHVATAGLLCANLEFYLRVALKSMLKAFSNVPTLTDTTEFFERQRHLYAEVLKSLRPSEKGVVGSEALLASLLE